MQKCPKCGTLNPEGARNCRECYHPFGLERVLQETGQAPAAPLPQGYAGGPPHGPGEFHQGPLPQQYPQQPPPGPGGPQGALPPDARVLSIRPLESKRKVHPAVWVGIAVAVVVIVFVAAWFITNTSSGPNPYIREVFDNMGGLRGWEADVRVDSSDFGMNPLSYSLYGSWEGKLVYQPPDRFSLSARSLDGQYAFEMRVINDTLYEKDSYSSHWSNLGPAAEEDKSVNPLWDSTLVDELSPQEEEGLEEIDGRMCKAYSFDEDITVAEETAFGQTMEITYHLAGTFYIDSGRDLLVSLDYIVEMESFGRSHYQYSFYAFDEPTLVDIPPGV